MHEMSVVAHVIDTVDAFAERCRVKEIQTVVLQLGAVSGVIPEFINECWAPAVYFSKHMKNSTVEMEEIPARGRCRDCGTEYDMQKYEGICPVCMSNKWEELSGSEIIIKEVRIAESDFLPPEQTEEKNGSC